MHFEAKRRWTRGLEPEQTFVDPTRKINADRPHVPHHLAGGLFKGEVDASFSPSAGGVHKVSGQTGLSGARRAGDQDAAAPEITLSGGNRSAPQKLLDNSRVIGYCRLDGCVEGHPEAGQTKAAEAARVDLSAAPSQS